MRIRGVRMWLGVCEPGEADELQLREVTDLFGLRLGDGDAMGETTDPGREFAANGLESSQHLERPRLIAAFGHRLDGQHTADQLEAIVEGFAEDALSQGSPL